MKLKMHDIIQPLMAEYFGLSAELASNMTEKQLNDIVYHLVGPEMGLLWAELDSKVILLRVL